MKKILFLAIISLLAVPMISQARTITKSESFSWTYTPEAEAEITGYTIFMLEGGNPEKEAIVNIPKSARFATGPVTYENGSVTKFYIKAYNDSDPTNIEWSGLSDVVRIHATPGNFKRN